MSTDTLNGKGARLRRLRQIAAGHVWPSMLKADMVVMARCVAAVDRGRHDAEIDAPTFDAYDEILGRVVVWSPVDRRPVVMRSRYCRPDESRDHALCKGRILYRAAA